MDVAQTQPRTSAAHPHAAAFPGHQTSAGEIDAFLARCVEQGRSKSTLSSYRLSLYRLLDWLPEDKTIRIGTIERWRDELLGRGMSARTAELNVSVANSLLEYCGRRDLQASTVKPETEAQPELTRGEYLRLLSTAKTLEHERTYLLIKSFGTLGLNVGELKELTAEAVEAGAVVLPQGERVYIPKCFQTELLAYAARNGIRSGPLFFGSGGKPLDRSGVWRMIAALGQDARVNEEKCNPRCLKRLCLQTKSDIRKSLELLETRMYDALLETEQRSVGWAEE